MAELELPMKKRTEIIDFLTKITEGSKEGYDSKKDSQLYAIYKHVSEERDRYIKDIRNFEREQHIETNLEEFHKYSNKELKQIGEDYGIYEPTTPRKQTETHKNIIIDPDLDCVERCIEEVRAMFGLDADLMSDEELRANGIILDISSYSRKYSEEKVNLIRAMIRIIVSSGLLDENLEPYNETILEFSTYEQIRELYERVRMVRPKVMRFEELELKYKNKVGK